MTKRLERPPEIGGKPTPGKRDITALPGGAAAPRPDTTYRGRDTTRDPQGIRIVDLLHPKLREEISDGTFPFRYPREREELISGKLTISTKLADNLSPLSYEAQRNLLEANPYAPTAGLREFARQIKDREDRGESLAEKGLEFFSSKQLNALALQFRETRAALLGSSDPLTRRDVLPVLSKEDLPEAHSARDLAPGRFHRFAPGQITLPDSYRPTDQPHPSVQVYTKWMDISRPRDFTLRDVSHTFNVIEYTGRNYAVLSDLDRQVIKLELEGFQRLGIQAGSIQTAVELGANCNCSAPMTYIPLLGEGSKLTLAEPSAPGRGFLNAVFDPNGRHGLAYMDIKKKLWVMENTHALWGQFADAIAQSAGEVVADASAQAKLPAFSGADFQNTFEQLLANVTPQDIVSAKIAELPPGQSEYVSMHYVAESIARTSQEAAQNFVDAIRLVKPGGVFSFAAEVESTGWNAGSDSSYSAAKMGMQIYEELFYHGIRGIENCKVSFTDPVFAGMVGSIGSTGTRLAVIQGRRSLNGELELVWQG